MTASDFIRLEGFLDPQECRVLIDCFQRNANLLFRNPAGDPFWVHRYLWMSSIPDTEGACKRIMQNARNRIIGMVREFYGEPREIFADSVQLVRWPPGVAMPPHADNCEPDGQPNIAPHRDYAAVVYLNEEFSGGEFYFVNLEVEIKPKTGLLVAFTGGLRHLHGVRAAEGAVRFTMPSWYTHDKSKADPCTWTVY